MAQRQKTDSISSAIITLLTLPAQTSSEEPTRGHLADPRGSSPGANSTRSHPCAEEERSLLEDAVPRRSHGVPLLPLLPARHSVQNPETRHPHHPWESNALSPFEEEKKQSGDSKTLTVLTKRRRVSCTCVESLVT